MPRVKLDYIVSFSSEDTDNPANNLLQWDITKKKWLCPKGESHCSVVVQLVKSTKISAVHIGAYHAALVEVLVGRSETPNDQFQVLVPSSIFLTPIESRKEENVEKVRSFNAEQFAEAARDQKWDRVRVVCSQPYNKHCKFGLSFIQIYEPESSSNPSSTAPAISVAQATSAVPARLLALDACSSDEDEFRPGQLFATHSQSSTGSETQNIDTGLQIRQATSQALKNISDTSAKLVRTPIVKTKQNQQDRDDQVSDRHRHGLMYEKEDDDPNPRIDSTLQKHKAEINRQDSKRIVSSESDTNKDKLKYDSNVSKDKNRHNKDSKEKLTTVKAKPQSDNEAPSGETHSHDRKESRKRQRTEMRDTKKGGEGLRAGPVSDSPHTLMRDVVFVLSGYENPRRGFLRTAALAMGARCQRDWGPQCTHLICAFPNTPKLKQVRASPGGADVAVVKGEWLDECAARRRLLPWQWYATEPGRRVPIPEHLDDSPPPPETVHHSECDTDDEIEKVMSEQKRRRPNEEPSPGTVSPPGEPVGDVSRESDVQFLRDERVQGNVTVADTDSDATDENTDADAQEPMQIDESNSLPDFFEGYTFAIDESVAQEEVDAELLGRYVRAYGGTLLQASQLDEESYVDYVLCGRHSAGKVLGAPVRADWVWRCHRDKRLCPPDQYKLT